MSSLVRSFPLRILMPPFSKYFVGSLGEYVEKVRKNGEVFFMSQNGGGMLQLTDEEKGELLPKNVFSIALGSLCLASL